MLHFSKSAKAYTDAKVLENELKKHYPSYQKAKQNDFENLKDKLDAAIINGAWQRKRIEKGKHVTERNPWTDVDNLIEYLNTL